MEVVPANPRNGKLLRPSPLVQSQLKSEMKPHYFEILTMITRGKYGKLFKACLKAKYNSTQASSSAEYYAIKQLNKEKFKSSSNSSNRPSLAFLQTQVHGMYALSHSSLTQLIDHFEDEQNVYLMFEFVKGINLEQELKKSKRIDSSTSRKYIADIILVLEFLHSQQPPLAHTNLKIANIIIDENQNHAKLIDFGWNTNIKDDLKQLWKQDIHNLASLIFELLAGEPLLLQKGKNQTKDIQEISLTDEDDDDFQNEKGSELLFPRNFPKPAKDLIESIIKSDSSNPFTLAEIKKHSWFFEESGRNIFTTSYYSTRSNQTLKQKNLFATSINDQGSFTNEFINSFLHRLRPQFFEELSTRKSVLSISQAPIQQNESVKILDKSEITRTLEERKQQIKQFRNEKETRKFSSVNSTKKRRNSQTEDRELKELQIELKMLESSMIGSIGGAKQMEQEVAKLKGIIEKKEVEVQELKKQVAELQADNDQLKVFLLEKSSDDFINEINALKQQLQDEKDKAIKSDGDLNDQLQELRGKISVLIRNQETGSSAQVDQIHTNIVLATRELEGVFEKLQVQFQASKDQIEIHEQFAKIQHELLKYRVERKTLEEDMRAEISYESELAIQQLKVTHELALRNAEEEHRMILLEEQIKYKEMLTREKEFSVQVQQWNEIQEQLKYAVATIDYLRIENDNLKEIKATFEKTCSEQEQKIQDLEQQLNIETNSK